jgi:uncharacterized protein (DUF1800 family)
MDDPRLEAMMRLDEDDARHLVSRTGLGTHPSEVAALAGQIRREAIDRVIDARRLTPSTSPPTWTAAPPRPGRELARELGDRKKVQKLLRERALELKTWWLREMIETDCPFTERLTLCWHNHFTSSFRKVRRPKLLFWQNKLLRRHALGNFRTFVREVGRDPAMLVYLDNIGNFAGRLNENLARELLELFTLGEGHFAETDVKAAARALTGWTVSRSNGEFRNARRRHDTGTKTFLGRTGAFDGDDIIDIIFEQPQCARHVVRKLWREFITTPLAAADHHRLAELLRQNEFELRPLVRTILRHDAFWSANNRGTRIKSPVELVVGLVRTLGLTVPDDRLLVKACRALGQDVFDPPNVKGWAGGEAWIASNTLLRRVMVLSRASRAPSRASSDPETWLAELYHDDPLDVRMQRVLLARPAVAKSPPVDSPRQFLGQLLTDPSYQLA